MNDVPKPESSPPRRRSRRLLVLILAIVVVVIAYIAGVVPRLHARQRARSDTAAMAVPDVETVRPERAAPAQEITLPGAVQAYASAPIFARATGYVRKWYADIGTPVTQGQVLAEIEIPEVAQQLQQARGALETAQANLRVSEATAGRYTGLAATRAVSQQQVDAAVGEFHANQATVKSAQANVRQLENLLSYAEVRAPFDGVITMRNVDVGDLINAGNSGPANTALFQIVQSTKLRVYVTVPEAYAHSVKTGMTAALTIAGFQGRRFTGTLMRTANAIDPKTRTLLVEIEVNNPSRELFAGTYAEVHIDIPATQQVFMLSIETLLFRSEGLQVATVTNGRVVLKSVSPGRDFGDRIEIVHGLTGDESVIVSPSDSIADGSPVRIAPTRAARR